jgi:hypothetical protein
MTKAEFSALMKQARATNEERDIGDRKAGFAAPGPEDPALWLRTMILAFQCGLQIDDKNAIAEGLDMLISYEHLLRCTEGEEGISAKRYEPWV